MYKILSLISAVIVHSQNPIDGSSSLLKVRFFVYATSHPFFFYPKIPVPKLELGFFFSFENIYFAGSSSNMPEA
jgi:hypothetical protein